MLNVYYSRAFVLVLWLYNCHPIVNINHHLLLIHTEILIPPENQIVVLGQNSTFFCQLRGEILRVRIGELTFSPVLDQSGVLSDDIIVESETVTFSPEHGKTQNFTITIRGFAEYNNSIVTCIADAIEARATLTLVNQGRIYQLT